MRTAMQSVCRINVFFDPRKLDPDRPVKDTGCFLDIHGLVDKAFTRFIIKDDLAVIILPHALTDIRPDILRAGHQAY